MDLIDRRAAMDELDKLNMIDTYETDGDVYLKVRAQDVADMLNQLPSAQPEIIRCKHCRHRGRLECPLGITVFDAPKDDEFCSRAERRTDG